MVLAGSCHLCVAHGGPCQRVRAPLRHQGRCRTYWREPGTKEYSAVGHDAHLERSRSPIAASSSHEVEGRTPAALDSHGCRGLHVRPFRQLRDDEIAH